LKAVRRWREAQSARWQPIIREALAAHLAGVDRTADLQLLRKHQTRCLEECVVELLRSTQSPARGRPAALAVTLQVTARWERQFLSRSPSRRREAVARLGLVGREIGHNVLIAALADVNDFVRLEAARGLIRWGGPSDIEEVFRTANRQSPLVRAIMTDTLRRYAPALAVNALPAVLGSGEPRQLLVALEIFRVWGHTVYLPSLAPLFRHPDAGVRAAALNAAHLAKLTGEDAEPILQCLEDPDQQVRAAAAHAVGRLHLRGHVVQLARCFETSKNEASLAAGYALADLGGEGCGVLESAVLSGGRHAAAALAALERIAQLR
jgi:HEAT repeat protein